MAVSALPRLSNIPDTRSEDHAFGGITDVNGTLIASNGAIDGGLFSGTGTVDGVTTVAANARLSPGDLGIGTMKFNRSPSQISLDLLGTWDESIDDFPAPKTAEVVLGFGLGSALRCEGAAIAGVNSHDSISISSHAPTCGLFFVSGRAEP